MKKKKNTTVSDKTRALYERALVKSKKRKPKASFDPVAFIDENVQDPKDKKLLKKFVDDTEDLQEVVEHSKFQEVFDSLMGEASKKKDFRPDDVAKNIQRALLTLTLNMIPRAEIACIVDMKQSNAYALNSFMDQARALADELRSANNAEDQYQQIYGKIINPSFLGIANVLISEMFALKSSIDTEVSDKVVRKALKHRLDEATRSLGKYFSESQNSISARLMSYLQGDVTPLEIPSSLGTDTSKRKRRRRRDS